MKNVKEMKKIALKLVGMAIVMLAMLQIERIEVKAAEPNYLTFEALENSSVGFYINVNNDEYVMYQKSNGTGWGSWIVFNQSISAGHPEIIELNSGEKVRFKGKIKEIFFGGHIDEFHPVAYITGKVKVSGDITTLTNEVGKIDSLIDEDGNVIAKYNEMFKGATGLVSAEELILPRGKLSDGCYSLMFEGCTALTNIPKLTATDIAESCYSQMFKGCTSLTSAPELPATTLAKYCYDEMFIDCTSLVNAPKLPATTLAKSCYSQMFKGCASLTSAPELPATTLADSCYNEMFEDCASLTSAPELPATDLATSCYNQMFLNCKSLQNAPSELPATKLEDNCYSHMFESCEALTSAPELPATELVAGCYDQMFLNCKSLQSGPSELPAMELLRCCYSSMFLGCEALTKAPKLPATTLANSCYEGMFSGCEALTKAPKLPATELKRNCYTEMFMNCSSLKIAPDLLKLDMAGSDGGEEVPGCCERMFSGCTSLKAVPNITVDSLATGCFSSMFLDCVELEDIHCFTVPNLTLKPNCFFGMFSGCKKLALRKESCEGFEVPWEFSATVGDSLEDILDATYNMFDGYDIDLEKIEGEDYFYYIIEPRHTYYLKKFIFNITIEESENGTVTSNKSEASVGDEVELTVKPDEGYELESWDVSEVVEISDDNTFIMPFGNVTIKAIFRRIGSEPKHVKQDNKKKQEKKETVYVDYDTFKSELPAGTVLTMDIDNYKQYKDMKVHSLDKKTVANQKMIADFYASQMKKRAKILHTYGIYTRSEAPLIEAGARKVLSWNNLSIKTPGPIYAACYNQKDGAYLISGMVNEKGTAVFFDFRMHEATNVTIFTLE